MLHQAEQARKRVGQIVAAAVLHGIGRAHGPHGGVGQAQARPHLLRLQPIVHPGQVHVNQVIGQDVLVPAHPPGKSLLKPAHICGKNFRRVALFCAIARNCLSRKAPERLGILRKRLQCARQRPQAIRKRRFLGYIAPIARDCAANLSDPLVQRTDIPLKELHRSLAQVQHLAIGPGLDLRFRVHLDKLEFQLLRPHQQLHHRLAAVGAQRLVQAALLLQAARVHAADLRQGRFAQVPLNHTQPICVVHRAFSQPIG